MGTIKQADSIVRLHRQLGLKSWYIDAADPIGSSQKLHDRVLSASNAAIQAEFKAINEVTGFNRDVNPSTDGQQVLIAKLEKQIFGLPRTASWSLTYGDADLKIKALRQRLSAGKALGGTQ